MQNLSGGVPRDTQQCLHAFGQTIRAMRGFSFMLGHTVESARGNLPEEWYIGDLLERQIEDLQSIHDTLTEQIADAKSAPRATPTVAEKAEEEAARQRLIARLFGEQASKPSAGPAASAGDVPDAAEIARELKIKPATVERVIQKLLGVPLSASSTGEEDAA